MIANNLYLIGRDKDGGEWVMAVQDRPKSLAGFRELARERLAASEKFIAVEIHEHTSRLVEVVSEYDDARGNGMGGFTLSAPAVEVVRCRDCNWFFPDDLYGDACRWFCRKNDNPDGFCAWGERKVEV